MEARVRTCRHRRDQADADQHRGDQRVPAVRRLRSVFPDQLAPITRIGGGEVRVDRALLSPLVVSDVDG